MSSTNWLVCCLVLLFACTGASAENSKSRVRFYTGNLSVGYFMEYWGTGAPSPSDQATPEFCAQMKDVGVSAVCDYLAWCRAESEPGKWDWSYYDTNERVLHENGLQYNVFCWLHFPPKWYMASADYVPYKCIEHDLPVQQTSIWAPGTLKAYDRFYKALAEHFGDKIDFLRFATPAEYGEIGYPNGMTNWLVKQEHVHPGFWCNDKYARADFRAQMQKRYQTIARLNKAWGTGFKSFGEIDYPQAAKDASRIKAPLEMTPGERRWMLDFVGWYYDSMTGFARKSVAIAQRYFPKKEIIVSMGYGSQHRFYGNDDVGVARMCREMKLSCQTPGNIPYFCMKSLSSPCRFYGIPYYTEPPGGMTPNQEVDRIWSDASCGTQTYFDYPGNLTGAKDVFAKYGRYLDGSKSIVDMAVFFPTTDHRLRNEDWPQKTIEGTGPLREYLDYDLIDERMIADGALSRYRMLIMFEDNMVVEAKTLTAIEKWVRSGGVLVMKDPDQIQSIEGKTWYAWKLETGLVHLQEPGDVGGFTNQQGKGEIVVQRGMKQDEFAGYLVDLAHNLSKERPGMKNVPLIGDAADGITATLFPNRILYLNPMDKGITKRVQLRKSDFPANGRTGRPARMDNTLTLPPHSIGQIELR